MSIVGENEWEMESDSEWMGEDDLSSGPFTVGGESKGQGSISPGGGDPCVCDPCVCEDGEEEISPGGFDPCACDDICPGSVCDSKVALDPNACSCDPCDCLLEPELPVADPNECSCLPCECDVPEAPPPEREPSCPKCCANNVKCTCLHLPPEPPKDPLDPFMRKLDTALVRQQMTTCRSIFPHLRPRMRLTEGIVLDVLVKDMAGKPVIYLPGSQLYPKIISDRLDDEDMKTISNVMIELRGVSTISVPYNCVSDVGLEILASVLLDNPSVMHLNVMNNEITGEGLLPFCLKVMTREPLVSLRLSGNKFGDMGYEALACLALSGHLPGDLDLSETDMGVTGLQAFFAALMALDHSEDYPPHYVTRGIELPVDLEILKQYKALYNDSVRKTNVMTSEKTGTADLYRLDTPEQWDKYENPEKVSPVPDIMQPEVAQKFSASVLQTLFDISQRSVLDPPNPAPGQLLADYPPKTVAQIIESAKGQGDLDDFIRALTSERKKPPLEKVTNYREIPILSSDLYKIEPSKPVYHEFIPDVDNPDICNLLDGQGHGHGQGDPDEPFIFRGQVVDTAESILTKDMHKVLLESESVMTRHAHGHQFSIDEYTAENAAKKYLRGVFNEAGDMAGCSEMDDQSNVVQLVLMTIVEIVRRGQQTRVLGGQSPDLSEEDCKLITEEAIDRVMTLLEPKVPLGCELSQDTLRIFIESLFETTEGTFINLLENPCLMEALHDTGTLAQQLQALREKKAFSEITFPAPKNQIHYLASKFLDGVLEEAGRIIGTGDPLNYRQLDDIQYLQKLRSSNHDLSDVPEGDPIVSFVKDIMDMGTTIGMQTIVEATEASQAKEDYTLACEVVVDDLFEGVQKFMIDHEAFESHLQEKEEDDAISELRYPYVSRPTRLVLNRPLFHPGQVEVIGMMLGDYVKDNSSLKELHIQKWMLSEAGMLAFMERAMANRTLVLLDLANNELGYDGVKLLSQYITLNVNLKHLILSHNRLRDPGITLLARTICDSGLESLNVAFNDLTEVGLDLLLSQIPWTKVNALYLWGNAFGLKTFEWYKDLLDSGQVKFTDTLVQEVDGQGFIVRNSQVRDTNYWYDVPPYTDAGPHLVVPPYLQKTTKIRKTTAQSQ